MGMFSPAIMILLALSASGGTRRPASVALTWEGKGVGLEVVDFLRFRLKETFAIDAASVPIDPAGDGDFHVHVAALANEVFDVRVDEAGATIASRELVSPEDVGTELWFFMKTTLRRALVSASTAPGGPHFEPPGQEASVQQSSASKLAPAGVDLREKSGSEVAVRVTGGLSLGASALEKMGMVGADYRFDLGDTGIGLVLGAEAGYFASSPRPELDVVRIPISLSAGVRLSESVPLVLGMFAGIDRVRAESAQASASAFVGSFGPFVRGRAELIDRLAVVLDVHGRLALPRVRYLLPDGRVAILESVATVAVTTGVEMRWH